MKTKDKILFFLNKKEQFTVNELVNHLNMSNQYVHRVLNDLEDEGLVRKIGTTPKVLYTRPESVKASDNQTVNYDVEKFLKDHLLLVDPLGKLLEGYDAMQYWCEKQNLPFGKTTQEFIETRQVYLNFYDENHLIDGLVKLKNTQGIRQIGVDQLFYLDFYVIERFGKTKLGTLMHYAKQGQNKNLMKIIVSEIKQSIFRLVEMEKIDAVLFVPPTIKRNVQIMNYLKIHLKIPLPHVKINKLQNQIVVPQKALSKLFERVINAKNTFDVPLQEQFTHVLIIDDAVGSGATINEIALKVKAQGIAQKITGLAITGSFKGFDVISEL
ncbi:MAG: MarR family transcriptional regulator [Saprospiraceae bacterium]|nr:MarR family transcriptional regulator [Saprospiraceae bacterium]